MPGPDPNHWLHRLTSDEWLSVAEGELARARAALVGKQVRAGVTQARRAAGMALNAALALDADEAARARYGRSYMDHLNALATDQSAPPSAREAARMLVEAPLKTDLVPLGPGDARFADAAAEVLRHARARLTAALPAQ